MLVGQEWLIKQIHLAGKPKNTLVATGGDLNVGVLHLTEEFSLTLDFFTNSQGVKIHRFCFGDLRVIEIKSDIEWNTIKEVIQTALTEAGNSPDYINEVIQSFTSVLFDSLLQFQQDEYLHKLTTYHPYDNLDEVTEAEENQLLGTLTKEPA